jgi:hypothetical protein
VSIFAHTLATIIINKRVSYMSIGFLVADLVMLAMEIDFAFLTTVIINIHVNYTSIEFLVAELGMLAMKIDFAF